MPEITQEHGPYEHIKLGAEFKCPNCQSRIYLNRSEVIALAPEWLKSYPDVVFMKCIVCREHEIHNRIFSSRDDAYNDYAVGGCLAVFFLVLTIWIVLSFVFGSQ